MRWLVIIVLLSACSRNSGHIVYVTDAGSGEVSVIDPAKRAAIAAIPVGDEPHAIGLAQDGDMLIVALRDGIAIVDRATQTLLQTIPVVTPRALAIAGDFAYIASPHVLSVLDISGGRVTRSADICGDPEGVAVTANAVLVACNDERKLQVVNRETLAADVPVGPEPRAVVADGDRAYVGGAAITVIDTGTNTVLRTIATPAADVALVGKDAVLVTNPGRGSAALVTAEGTITEVAKVGAGPGGIAVDGNRAYVANGPANDISVVDTARHRVIGHIATGIDPTSVVVAAPPRGSSPLPHLGRVPSFAFVDHNGHALASADLRGGPWIANFIFTRCPTACPLYTQRMAALHHALPALRLVSFSVDPEFDTPERLRDFATRYDALTPAWSFVTGPFEAIRTAVIGGFKVAMGRDERHREGNIFHGEQAVLVDGGGAIRGYYALSDAEVATKIAADVARLGIAMAAH